MADITQQFFQAVASGTRFQEAFNLLNGMDMFGMLRALNALDAPMLRELRLRQPQFGNWGGPNIARMNFAMDVVQTRTVPAPPAGLPADQVTAANTFLAATAAGGLTRHEGVVAIESWTARYKQGDQSVDNRFLYPAAVPYLALEQKGMIAMRSLDVGCYGGKLANVHGLAVHCTAGGVGPSAYGVAQNRCVPTWNDNGASAHFAISGDGTVVQFIPTSHVAFAQGAGNPFWISVEIDNDGIATMTLPQLSAVKQLFAWVCRSFAVPRSLATGHICKVESWDRITRSVCNFSNAFVSESRGETIGSHGLSCHRGLDFGGGRACPGAGILSQLPSIANPLMVC
jgi:hypothetical protein